MSLLRSPSRQLDREVYKAHQAWVKAGGKGPGRLIAKGEVLRRMVASALQLEGAQFVGCDMKEADLNNTHLRAALLDDCDLGQANLYMTDFEGATLRDCRMAEARLALARIVDANVFGCDLAAVSAARLLLREASVERTSFRGALLLDAETRDSRFTECNFRDANFARKVGGPKLGATSGVRFEYCDFRGTDFTGRTISDSTFVNCLFHGAVGVPEIGAGVFVVGADLSPEGDGSDLVEPATFVERWKSGALSALH